MAASLAFIGGWPSAFIFGVGGILLGSDYAMVKLISPSAYNWINQETPLLEKTYTNYQTAKYIDEFRDHIGEENLDRLPLSVENDGTLSAHVPEEMDVEEGMEFWLCVDYDYTHPPTGEDYEFPLRIGIAEVVDRQTAANTERYILSLEPEKWLHNFETRNRRQVAESCRSAVTEGDSEQFSPIAKIRTNEDFEQKRDEFDSDTWKKIHEWCEVVHEQRQ